MERHGIAFTKIRSLELAITVACVLLCASVAHAQRAASTDTSQCDAIVAAARVDSVAAALFVSAMRIDGGEIEERQTRRIADDVGAAFVQPRPFRMTVFSGPPLMRSLRTTGADTTPELRAPALRASTGSSRRRQARW